MKARKLNRVEEPTREKASFGKERLHVLHCTGILKRCDCKFKWKRNLQVSEPNENWWLDLALNMQAYGQRCYILKLYLTLISQDRLYHLELLLKRKQACCKQNIQCFASLCSCKATGNSREAGGIDKQTIPSSRESTSWEHQWCRPDCPRNLQNNTGAGESQNCHRQRLWLWRNSSQAS